MGSSGCLAAILAADVAGYSRLMGADEEGTLQRLNALRRELVDPKIAEHHGRIVKTTGDGLLGDLHGAKRPTKISVRGRARKQDRNARLVQAVAPLRASATAANSRNNRN